MQAVLRVASRLINQIKDVLIVLTMGHCSLFFNRAMLLEHTFLETDFAILFVGICVGTVNFAVELVRSLDFANKFVRLVSLIVILAIATRLSALIYQAIAVLSMRIHGFPTGIVLLHLYHGRRIFTVMLHPGYNWLWLVVVSSAHNSWLAILIVGTLAVTILLLLLLLHHHAYLLGLGHLGGSLSNHIILTTWLLTL